MSFILPTVIVRIIDFVGIDKDRQIIFDSDNNNYALCKTLENDIILVRFLSNLKKIDINESVLTTFFEKKALNSFKPQNVLKLAKALSSNKEMKKAKTSLLKETMKKEHPEMDDDDILMEVMEQLSSSFETEAKDIIIEDKTIRKNSVIRIPLSSGKKEFVTLQNKEIPVYESYSLLMNKEREPRESGMYLFSSNRQSIPLIFEKNKNGSYSIRFNGLFANKDILLTLFRHSIRTFEHTGGYMLTIYLSKNIENVEISELVESINKCTKSDSEKIHYVDLMKKIINWVEENENDKILTFRNSFIYLPKVLEKDLLFHGTLFDNLSSAIFNVSLRGLKYEDKEAIIEIIEKEKNNFFADRKLYGFYNILYDLPSKESNTYGFLENNIQSHQVMSNFSDSLDFYYYIREYFKSDLNSSSETSNDSEPKNIEF